MTKPSLSSLKKAKKEEDRKSRRLYIVLTVIFLLIIFVVTFEVGKFIAMLFEQLNGLKII